MNDDINDLQSRIAFQEDILQALNSRVVAQERDIATLKMQLQHLYKKFKSIEQAADLGSGGEVEPPPPHY